MRAIIPIAAADEAVIDLIPSALFNKVHNLAEVGPLQTYTLYC